MMVVCEPQCSGFEHAEVNAAMIKAAAMAFPDERFLFLAEEGHLTVVSGLLDAAILSRIESRVLTIAPRRASNLKRFFLEYSVYKSAIRFAVHYGSKKILYLSVTSPGLIWIKVLTRIRRDIQTVATLHGMLETVDDIKAAISYQLIFWLRFTLLAMNYKKLHYLVFGTFIKKSIDDKFRRLSLFTRSMDLPYEFAPIVNREPFQAQSVRFGALGVGSRSKGTDVFFRVAGDIMSGKTVYIPQFQLIGPITDRSLKIPLGVRVLSADGRPLSRKDYRQYAEELDYAVFFHKPSNYRYSASAAFFDALAYGKPVIALRNPMFQYYFDLLGDIGHLCDTEGEMKNTIQNILDTPSKELYNEQQNNISKGRERLNATHSAHQFKEIW